MNAPTSHSKSITCPICKRTSIISPVGMLNGLFTCPHCHSNLVISWSGHYVRDPFTSYRIRQTNTTRMLRKPSSRSVPKTSRDFRMGRRLRLLAIFGSILFLSVAIASVEQSKSPQKLWQDFQEWISGNSNPSS